MKPVCLVVGAGAGIGGTVGKRFAGEGYHVALCRRSDAEGLSTLVADIKAEGGEASGCLLNAAEEHTLEDMISATEKGVGPIEVVVLNCCVTDTKVTPCSSKISTSLAKSVSDLVKRSIL